MFRFAAAANRRVIAPLTSSPIAGPIVGEVVMPHLAPPTLTAAEQKANLRVAAGSHCEHT